MVGGSGGSSILLSKLERKQEEMRSMNQVPEDVWVAASPNPLSCSFKVALWRCVYIALVKCLWPCPAAGPYPPDPIWHMLNPRIPNLNAALPLKCGTFPKTSQATQTYWTTGIKEHWASLYPPRNFAHDQIKVNISFLQSKPSFFDWVHNLDNTVTPGQIRPSFYIDRNLPGFAEE